MTEFNIRISLNVDARDHDEAVEIAKAIRAAIEDKHAAHGYKVRDVESDTEEV